MTDRAVKWEEVVFPTYTNLDGRTVGRELGYRGTVRVDDERTAEVTVKPNNMAAGWKWDHRDGSTAEWVWQVNSFVDGKYANDCSGFGLAATAEEAMHAAEMRISEYRMGEDLAWWDHVMGLAGR